MRRTENAFTRASITSAKDKFAHLESIISVDLHPSINAYFNGSATQSQYDEFLAFLRKRYGRTKQQKIRAALEGVRRAGRLPTDLVAMIREQFDDVSIEDIMKAHFMAEMPQQVKNQLADKQDEMSLNDLAKAAEPHFNQDGSLRATNAQVNSINSSAPTTWGTVSQPVQPDSFTAPFNSDDSTSQHEVNAVNRRVQSSYSSSGSSGPGFDRSSGRPNSRPQNGSRPRGPPKRSASRPSSNRSATSNPDYCWLHNKHGDNANFCKPPCGHPRSAAMQQQQQQQGNGRGGRR